MDAKAFSSAISKFSTKFCNELNKSKDVVCSPLSAEYLLALLTLGATDPAHKELLTSLGFPNDDSIRSSFTSLTSKLKTIEDVTLHLANRVYLNQGKYELNSELKEDATNVFDISIEKLNFDDGPTSAREINKWVASETKDRITKILALDSIDSNSRLVLISAMYFEGLWKHGFNPNMIKERPFYIHNQATVDVPMMHREDRFNYRVSNNLKAQILEMYYKDQQTSMIFVLPDSIEGLNEVLEKLAGGYDLMSDLNKMISTKVQVTIPKFKIETETNLMEILPKLGINIIFNKTDSGLKNILDNDEPLHVTNAVQKVFIEVKEDGAEASTGSGIDVMMYNAGPMPVPRFYADRPFLFMLNGADRATLLVGAYRGVA